jgi:hypothetical protein
MELTRKELEQLLFNLKPQPLSDHALSRFEQAMSGLLLLDSSQKAIESQLGELKPRTLTEETLDRCMDIVQKVPFAINEKVVLFPGACKDLLNQAPSHRRVSRWLAVAAMVAMGTLAALITPFNPASQQATVGKSYSPLLNRPTTALTNGIVATSYGTGIEQASDEGVIWTDHQQPRRVLRFEYQDRVLVRDQNGVDRMLFIPREEVLVLPEKVD